MHAILILDYDYFQPVRLLVLARAYQPWYSIFLSQRTSTSRAYQPSKQADCMMLIRLHVCYSVTCFVKYESTSQLAT